MASPQRDAHLRRLRRVYEAAARLGITVNALRQVKFRVGRMIAAVEALYGE